MTQATAIVTDNPVPHIPRGTSLRLAASRNPARSPMASKAATPRAP